MNAKKEAIKPTNLLNVHSKGHNPLYPITLDNPFKATSPNHSDMRVNPYKIKERYLNWKLKTHSGIPEITEM